MKNFELFEEIFHSGGEEPVDGFCQEMRKWLAEKPNKEAVSNLFHLGLTSTVALLLQWQLHGHSYWKAWNLHTRVSNVLSSISENANDNFKENSWEERKAFIETLVAVL